MKILNVTGTRADWGLLAPVLDILRDDERFELEIAITGQHLMRGSTSHKAIENDGHRIAHELNMKLGTDDSPEALARGMGRCTADLGAVLAENRPDFLLILGDRYEIMAAVMAAVIARVPVAHLCGGDITEGAIDDSIRHAITKLATLHFVTNSGSAKRIVQLGENPNHIHNVGSTGIDRIRSLTPLPREDFFNSVGLSPQQKNFIITFHPETLSADPMAQAKALLSALETFPQTGLIFTGSNADPGARAIDALVKEFADQHDNAVFHETLGSLRYFSALEHCDLVIGNSSSGIMEAPSFHKATINIGDRQARRPRAESVIDCKASHDAICKAIQMGLKLECSSVQNPYGNGDSAKQIAEILAAIEAPEKLVRKSFVDK